MKSLRVGSEFYLNASEILFVVPFGARLAARERRTAKAEGRFVDASEGGKSRAILVMKGGQVVGSPSTPATLVSRVLIEPLRKPSTRQPNGVSEDADDAAPDTSGGAIADEIADIEGGE